MKQLDEAIHPDRRYPLLQAELHRDLALLLESEGIEDIITSVLRLLPEKTIHHGYDGFGFGSIHQSQLYESIYKLFKPLKKNVSWTREASLSLRM